MVQLARLPETAKLDLTGRTLCTRKAVSPFMGSGKTRQSLQNSIIKATARVLHVNPDLGKRLRSDVLNATPPTELPAAARLDVASVCDVVSISQVRLGSNKTC